MRASSEVFFITSHVAQSIREGQSVHSVISVDSFKSQFGSELWIGLRSIISATNKRNRVDELKSKFRHPHQHLLIELIVLGLEGHPIFDKLKDFESIIFERDIAVIERHQRLLPYKAMLPVFLLIVPGYFLLLFGFVIKFLEIRGF